MSQVRPEALAAALERGLPAIAWIHGDEPLLALEAADAVRAAARAAGATERIVFEGGRGFRPEALAAEAGALSLFGVVGVGLRQLIRPTGEASHEEKRKGS